MQGLFPLPTRSAAVLGSPVLEASDIEVISGDPRAVEMLKCASERLLRFYGSTEDWLSRFDHDHLRITRIIQSLRLLVGPVAAQRFNNAVIALHEAAGASANQDSLRYGTKTLGEP